MDEPVEAVIPAPAPAPAVPLTLGDAPAAPVVPVSAAPVEPHKPEPKTDEGHKPFEYDDVPDDPGLSMALKFVGKLGFSPEHPAMASALKGDFSVLEATLATLGPKAQGYEAMLKLAKQSFDANVSKQAAAVKATTDAVHSVVGGPEQWGEIAKWASANADPAEKETINRMMNSGDAFQAKMAASFLRDSYAKSVGAVIEPQEAAAKRPANGASPAQGAISPEQFQQEMAKLMKTYGSNIGNLPEYKALQSRRAAYRG